MFGVMEDGQMWLEILSGPSTIHACMELIITVKPLEVVSVFWIYHFTVALLLSHFCFCFLVSSICVQLIDVSITKIPFPFSRSFNCHQSRSSELLISLSIYLRMEGFPLKILLESLATGLCSIPSLNVHFSRIIFQAALHMSSCLFLLLFFWLPHLQTLSHMWMVKVFLSRKQRAPLRFSSPVSDLGVAVEFRGCFFLVWEGWGCKRRKGEVKELHSCEQVQSWAKLRMMDWALYGLQLVFGGNK